jgi:pimeloyl-ACP methyl ester carboxylesterase
MIGRFVSTVIDIRRVVDWAETQTDVDPQRIALIGFSMGALVASVAMANEPRLAAGVLVMGGADPHDVLATCDHEIERGRNHIREHLDWSLDQYRHELAKALARINPARFAGMVDPRRVLIIEAAADTCVPQTARERLWQAMGRPERIAYLYDHRVAFLAMTFLGGNNLQQQIYRFLDRRFPVASDPAAVAGAGAEDRAAIPCQRWCGRLADNVRADVRCRPTAGLASNATSLSKIAPAGCGVSSLWRTGGNRWRRKLYPTESFPSWRGLQRREIVALPGGSGARI